MFGLIGRMTAIEGRRDDLVGILLESVGNMPGCLSYIVSVDPEDNSAIWITEVWDSIESHKGSLALPEVKRAISLAMPLIATFEKGTVVTPVGGHGLVRATF